jgi:hypothetical protein
MRTCDAGTVDADADARGRWRRRFGVRSMTPSPLDRPAGIASATSADDAGALRTDVGSRGFGVAKDEREYVPTTTTTGGAVRGGDCADVEHAMEIAARRRIKRETARAYREALDEQIRARDAKLKNAGVDSRRYDDVDDYRAGRGGVSALGERAMNVVDDDWTTSQRLASTREAKAENEERRRRRDAYVAALDAQVAERRERARREKERREREDREEDARIAAAIEEERAVLEEKRALMARSASSGENASVSAPGRKPRVTHSPPASPRPSPRPPPPRIHVDDDDGDDAHADEGYEPIPEFPDDASSTRELVAIIRELVVERGEMSRRLADAEARIARLQRQRDDDDI